jgi:UDP-N-acetylmuramyl tripeptide synthase
LGLRAWLALWMGKASFIALRLLGRGASTLPGRLALRVDPTLIAALARRLRRGCAVVTGTNGKTTTATMLAAGVAADGRSIAHNRTGANLASGVASALIAATGWGGAGRDQAVAEVDEASMPGVCRALRPRVAVVTNFFRDQLDRYGELQTAVALVRRGLAAMPAGGVAVLNADDPLAAGLGESEAAAHLRRVYFGVDTDLPDDPGQAPSDAGHCPRCGRPFRYAARHYAHLGRYACDGCGLRRPVPDVALVALDEPRDRPGAAVAAGAPSWPLGGATGAPSWPQGGATPSASAPAAGRPGPERPAQVGPLAWRLHLRTPSGPLSFELAAGGLYNVYNALAAAAGALALGVAPDALARSLTAFRSSFGRMEAVPIDGRTALLVLVKNPVGLSEVLRTLARDPDPRKGVLIAINDRYADGRDVSWLWDADVERLAGVSFATVIASGSRAEDMALRLKYAGIASERVAVEPELAAALRRGIDAVPPGATLYVLPTYTAMLALREQISRRGLARRFWQV